MNRTCMERSLVGRNATTTRRQATLAATGLLLSLTGITSATGAATADDVAALRARLERQQAVIDAQQQQLAAQELRLREQERLVRELVAKAGIVAPQGVDAVPADSNGAPIAVGVQTLPAATDIGPGGKPAAEIATPSVSTRFDGVDVSLFGALRTTVTTTTARMQPDAAPFFVLPPVPGAADGTTKIDARLSSVALSVQGYELGDFQLGGLMYAYLFDGDLFSGKYGVFPGIAYIDATSDRWRFALGLQQDVFSPMIPGMVDRMSAFAGSGNVGNSFKPQLRVERYFMRGDDKLTLQGALADPLPSNIKPGFVDSTENAGIPNVEARIAWTRGKADDGWLPWPEVTLGISAAYGRFRTLYDAEPAPEADRIRSYETSLHGVALEAGWRIGDRFGIQGEIYQGRALGPYLGTIFQTVNGATRQPIASSGAWAEAAWYWSRELHSHLGIGVDRADQADHPAFRSNATAFANLFWDPGVMTTLGLEATWRRTEYFGGIDNDGFALMLSSELRF